MTILARGRTGGFAMTADEDDKGMYTRDELFARMVFAMGGRSAEELVFGAPTTGASNDIEQATKIARAMVTEYGMTSALGPVKYGQEQGDPFSGRGSGGSLEYSPAVAAKIDEEMQMLLDEAHKVAYATLERYRDELDTLASKLLEKETLRRGDLEAIFDTVEPVRPALPAHDARFGRQADREPVKTPVEIAKERGEEPPKRFSILEASKATRERRRKEREAEQNPAPKKGSTRWQQPKHNEPQYGGPKPPEGWTYKGAPKEQHPGTRNYPAENTEQIGFRLPENERPNHASRGPEPETTPDAETTQLPREERAPKHRRDDD